MQDGQDGNAGGGRYVEDRKGKTPEAHPTHLAGHDLKALRMSLDQPKSHVNRSEELRAEALGATCIPFGGDEKVSLGGRSDDNFRLHPTSFASRARTSSQGTPASGSLR